MDPTMLAQLASMFGGGNQGGGSGGHALFGGGNLAGLGQMFSGLFGDSGAPYRAAEKELGDFYNRARDVQNPFMQFGQQAMPKMNQWLSQMKDPSGFINHLMGNYSESPWAKYQQEQALRAAGNAGSVGDTAVGGLGSTPMAQFEQQNARNISSQDMNTWLQNVLGVNTTYGQGLNNQLGYGQHAADSLTDINKEFGKGIAAMQYGAKLGDQQDRNSIWGGLFG
jgi:hypothetical protein